VSGKPPALLLLIYSFQDFVFQILMNADRVGFLYKKTEQGSGFLVPVAFLFLSQEGL
jgi:hypothetical protein